MTDEEIYNQLVELTQTHKHSRYVDYDLINIPKEHIAAYDIQNCFIPDRRQRDLYSSPYYEYVIYNEDCEQSIYSKNNGISGFLYLHKRFQVLVLKNVKTSKSICIHDATPSWERFCTFKTYTKILEAVRYILSE